MNAVMNTVAASTILPEIDISRARRTDGTSKSGGARTASLMRRPSRTSPILGRRTLLLIAGGWAMLWLVWSLWLGDMLADAAAAPGADWLGRRIAARQAADPNWLDPGHVAWVGRTVLTRLGLCWAALCLAIAVWPRRGRLFAGLLARLHVPQHRVTHEALRPSGVGVGVGDCGKTSCKYWK